MGGAISSIRARADVSQNVQHEREAVGTLRIMSRVRRYRPMAARKKITRKAAKPATAKTKPASANRKSKAAAAARGVTKTVAKKASAEKSVTSKSASAKAVGAKAVAAKAPKSKAASGKAAEGASTLKSAEKKIQGAHRAAATEVPTPVAEPVKSVSKPSASIKVDAIKVTSLRGETPKSEASRSALVNAEAVKQEHSLWC